MSKPIFIIIILLSSFLSAQEKYFIYFKDKGPENSYNQLNKNSVSYQETLNLLTDKAIERRIKNMGEETLLLRT